MLDETGKSMMKNVSGVKGNRKIMCGLCDLLEWLLKVIGSESTIKHLTRVFGGKFEPIPRKPSKRWE